MNKITRRGALRVGALAGASILLPQDMLRLHTLGTAKAIGVAEKVGSLEVGKFADFLLVDPTQHKSNTFSSYTLTFNPPLAAMANGFLAVEIESKITDGGGIVEIHGIKARLGHD